MSAELLTVRSPGVPGPDGSGPAAAREVGPGFYGKLPTVGDFVTRRLPRSFVDPFDEWLQHAIAASREQLGEAWLGLYLTSPVWRGVMTPGVCGERGWMVVMAPSVDRVGRYFPLTIAAPAPPDRSPLDSAHSAEAWYERAESALLDCLEAQLTLEAFDAQVRAAGVPAVAEPRPGAVRGGSARAWRFGAPDGLDGPAPLLTSAKALDLLMVSYTVWWSEGSDNVAPSLLVSAGLPPPEGYSSLLDGTFGRRGWADSGEVSAPEDEPRVVPPVGPPVRAPEHEQSQAPGPVLVVGGAALADNEPAIPGPVLVPPEAEPADPSPALDSPPLPVPQPDSSGEAPIASGYAQDSPEPVDAPAIGNASDPPQADRLAQDVVNDDGIGACVASNPGELDMPADAHTGEAFAPPSDEPATTELPDGYEPAQESAPREQENASEQGSQEHTPPQAGLDDERA